MFGIFSGVKMALIGGVAPVAVGGYIYVNGSKRSCSCKRK